MPYSLDEKPRRFGEEEHSAPEDDGEGELDGDWDSFVDLGPHEEWRVGD